MEVGRGFPIRLISVFIIFVNVMREKSFITVKEKGNIKGEN